MAVAVPAALKEQQEMMRPSELLGDHLQSNSAPVLHLGAASIEDRMLFKGEELLLVGVVCLEIQRYFYEYVYAVMVLVSNVNSLSFSAYNSSTELLNGIISGTVEAHTCKANPSPTGTTLPVDADIVPAKESGNGSRLECGAVGGAQYDDDDDDEDDGGDEEEAGGDGGGDVEEEGVEDVHGGGDEDEDNEDAAEDQAEGEGADDDDDDDDDPDEPYEEEEDEEDDEDDEEDNEEEEEPPKKRKK